MLRRIPKNVYFTSLGGSRVSVQPTDYKVYVDWPSRRAALGKVNNVFTAGFPPLPRFVFGEHQKLHERIFWMQLSRRALLCKGGEGLSILV